MRVCQRGWEYAQVFGEDGIVEVCSWASMNYRSLGKLTESSMYDIWHGDLAQKFRESLLDGSYCYCEKEKCPWMANGTLEEHMKDYDDVTEYPLDVSLSFQRTCNYTCTCCADNENIRPRTCDADSKLVVIKQEVEKFLNDVTTISANGRGELFASNHIMEMLHNWKPNRPKEDIHVILETNGSLFDEKHWEQIKNLGEYDLKVSITVMGFEEKTYQFLSGTKLPVSRIVDNLHFVQKLREQNIINNYEIGTVVQERNFREMPEFSRRCIEEFGADCVRLRPYFPFGKKDPGIKWVYDIRNPYHPYYSEYVEIMKDPIFQHPKVFMWSGEELSQMGKNPYGKDKENFDVIKYLATDSNMADKLDKYFKEQGFRKIIIYGFGYVGHAFTNICINTDIIVTQIVDRNKNGKYYKDIPINNIANATFGTDIPIVVTAPYFFEQIKSELEKANVLNPVYNIKDIINNIIV